MENTMKIALCLSGQLRTWKQCHASILDLKEKLGVKFNTEVDVFCQSWDFNSRQFGAWVPHARLYNSIKSTPVLLDEQQELINAYTPKSYLVETEDVSKRMVAPLIIKKAAQIKKEEYYWDATFAGSQFYSIKSVTQLKTEYEQKHNFTYDICIRSRHDLFFNDEQTAHTVKCDFSVPEENTLYSCHTALNSENGPRLGDVFWYASSETFNRVSKFYDWLHIMDNSIFPNSTLTEHVLWHYTKNNGINIVPIGVDPKIIR